MGIEDKQAAASTATTPLVMISAGAILFFAAASSAQTPPGGMKEKANLYDARYCELLVVKGNLLSAKATVYNTIGLNDCPPEQWESLKADKLKQELHATQVIMNGPRHFLMDRNALKAPGGVESFDGLAMRELAYVEVHPATAKRTPYTENTVERQTQYVFEKGREIYELLAPDERVYIMQSYSQEVDKNLNVGVLAGLGSRLHLPKGWKFRARKLDDDLVVRNSGTTAHVLQDELRNSYQRM